jgi:gas vesicle protein
MNDRPDYSDKQPEEIEQEIARTRARISEDIDAISYQLNPQRFRERAEDTLHTAQEAVMSTLHEVTDSVTNTVKETSSTVFDTIRQNPLPAALIGLGIGLLAAGSATAATQRHDAPADDWRADEFGGAGQYGSGQYGASSLASGRASQNSGLLRWVEEQPIAVGIIAALVGAAIGLGAPATRYEDRLIGEYGTEVRERAKHVVHDAADALKDKTKELRDKAKHEFDKQAAAVESSVKSLREDIAASVKDVAESAQDTARHEADRATAKVKGGATSQDKDF